MSDIITLFSSDDEETEPPRKKIKPTFLGAVTITPITKTPKKSKSEDVVILSDEEEIQFTEDKIIVSIEDDKNQEVKENNEVKNNHEQNNVNNTESEVETVEEDKTEIVDVNGSENVTEHIDDTQSGALFEVIEENSSGESSGKENIKDNGLSKASKINESSASSASTSKLPNTILLEKFVDICEESFKNSNYDVLKAKFSVFWKFYKKCEEKMGGSSNFKQLIQENMERARKSSALAVISFNEVFSHIKCVVDAVSIEVTEEDRLKLKKLEKTIKLLVSRIKHLEQADIDFDDEEDSSYLQLDRYVNRLNKVYSKYCELLKKNPHNGRLTYAKLDFVDSEYNEINRAISKKYKNNNTFPSYMEMENYVRKVVANENLELTEAKIKSESVHCFKKLGELLQTRRKRELYDCHYLYIKDGEDPATKDISLSSILKENYIEGQNKIEKLCQEYVTKEEDGIEAVSSEEDSDKSNYIDSENEEKSDN